MGQLQPGLYVSFQECPEKLFDKLEQLSEPDESLKLEMSWPVPGMVRVEVTNRSRSFHIYH